ncbi:glucose-6-phosphate 1-dehydrogenase [Sinomicrobium oceani]|uniref:Glucose-6-phosphate 1-dehydrogenase n=1 Tax=Sinomicrobium oceani TaxID=1150368 RepID=A0A1K1PF45_9FLAO|nr:glucose-6-phosphate dehydrogenase [Sinomicrobium oceani]SFW46400.1 glucose-6-phosphate 1-dehydrogenase [Sinomicrobium oceani]
MKSHKQTPTSIVVFGATGDLAKRKLFPAFFNLFLEGWMPEDFTIFSLGRKEHTDETFGEYILENIHNFSRNHDFSEAQWSQFREKIRYVPFDIKNDQSFYSLKKELDEYDSEIAHRTDRIFYLSIAPNFIENVSNNLKKYELVKDRIKDRIIIEKPFGYDKASAIHLNNLLSNNFEENQIYRIDHYLGKETVQNILAFRFANIMFEPLWNNKYIDSIQITVAEKVGVEERGSYYDGAGALRDMIQNHLMQILCMVAMEPPSVFKSSEIRNKKADVLKSVRRIHVEDIEHYTVRAQYTQGRIDGHDKVGYLEEPGVNPGSKTETFVAMKFYIDNERWNGVPFYMRTGKSMAAKQSSVVISFKEVPDDTFRNNKSMLSPNKLTINIQPEMDIKLSFMAKKPGLNMKLKPVDMVFDFFECSPNTPEAYETLLLDVLEGDPTLFMRSDQVEEAWDVISNIQEAWERFDIAKMQTYPAGSWGPEASDELLKRQGHYWISNSEIN